MPYTIMPLLSTSPEGVKKPTVIGAAKVSKEDRHFIAYGDFVPGVNTKWMRGAQQVMAYLHEIDLDRYIVVANQSALDIIDPGEVGKTLAESIVLFDEKVSTGSIGGIDFDDIMGRVVTKPGDEAKKAVEILK